MIKKLPFILGFLFVFALSSAQTTKSHPQLKTGNGNRSVQSEVPNSANSGTKNSPITGTETVPAKQTSPFEAGKDASTTNWLKSTRNSRSLSYIENIGQYEDIGSVKGTEILYGAREKGMEIYFTRKGLVYKLHSRRKVTKREWESFAKKNNIKENERDEEDKNGKYIPEEAIVEMNWEGSDPSAQVTSEAPLSNYFCYFTPLKDKKILSHAKGFTKITYKSIYPFIDVEYTIHADEGIEYAFILHPGADPSQIKMAYTGTDVNLDASQNIVLPTHLGNITDNAPQSFLGSVARGEKISSGFTLSGKNIVGFTLGTGTEKISQTTVIDPWTKGPPTLVNETALDVATDPSSNLIVYTADPSYRSYISKFDLNGNLLWVLDLYGNFGYDPANQGDVGADNSNNIYVSLGLNTQPGYGPYNTIKVDPSGSMIWGNFGGYSSRNLFESWNISFNCDQSQLIQSGGGLWTGGTPYYNVSMFETLNTSNGAEGAAHENDNYGDIVASLWAPSGLMYHLCSDQNSGATRTGAPTTGPGNYLVCVDPGAGYGVKFASNTGYRFTDGDNKSGVSVGMNAIASSCTYIYTTDGLYLDKWDQNTGAHYGQVVIPGGNNGVGSISSGIVCDKCGNIYVGSNGAVYIFDPSLTLINTIGGLPDVVTDMVWAKNGALYVCGGLTGNSPFVTSIAAPVCNLGSSGLSLAITQPTCSVAGSATATVSFCGAPYSYSWSNGATTQTVSGLAPGAYSVVVSGSVTCPFSYSDNSSFTINAPVNTVGASISSQANVNCFGSCSGSATVSPSGGTGSYGYSWSGGGGSGVTASSLCAGAYNCVITDGNGCTYTQAVTITQPGSALGSSVSSQSNVACNGGNSGSATVSPSGGAGGYSYNWSPAPGGGQGTATATGLSNGVYNCTITDANFCTHVQAVTISQPAAPISSSISSQTNVACNGGNSGAATINPSGGAGGYSYNWSPAPGGGQGTVTATGLSNGVYNCTITDANLCTHVQAVTITQPAAALSSSISAQTNVACTGGNTGSATINPSGGTGGYSYVWSPAPGGGQGTSTATGLSNGVYNCTITDANTCTHVQGITITQPGTSLTISSSSSTLTGCGTATGTATVTVTGGTGADTYTWSPVPGGGQGTNNATGLSATTYTVTIHDANLCPQSTTFTIPAAGGPSVTVSSSANAKCNASCDGTATVNVTGGVGPYTYSWTGGAGIAATASALCPATYTCTVHDANNCASTQTVTITSPSVLTASSGAQTNASCNGTATGSATVSASGGTPGYSYTWSPSGGNGATASSLATGTYTCTVHDANACASSQTFTITQPAVLVLTPSSTQTGCGVSTGTASVSAAGGTAGYNYVWSPAPGGGQNTANATGLPVGSYTVSVTDTKGCNKTSTYNITSANAPLASLSSSANLTCNAACTGTATVSASGGTGAFTYSWTGGAGNAASASSLCAGTYSCTITDANNCSVVQTAVITQPAALAVNPTQTNVACNGATTGSATATVSGGTTTYTYAWTPSGGNAATASGLTAGVYTCSIQDANACPISHTYTITQPAALTVAPSQTNVACNAALTGSATATPSGGNGAYAYSWTPSGGNAATASGLASGTYTCTVTDANSCSTTQVYTLTQPAALAVTPSQTNVTCNATGTGTASAVVSGGNGTYTYAWAPSGGNAATASGLTAGTYTCTIQDANACSTEQTYTITQPNTLTITPTQTNIACNSGSGTATASVSGGTTAYQYTWSPSGGNGATASGLAAGVYTCSVSDANSCTAAQTYTITQPATLGISPSQSNLTCNGNNTGSATALVSGGSATYTYAWAPSGGNGATASSLAAGTYTCTVTDANNCVASQTYTLTQPATLSTTASGTTATCSLANGSATASPAGGSGTYQYSWAPSGGNAATASGLTPGNYTCTVNDSLGCTASATVTVINTGTKPVASVNPSGSTSFCQGTSSVLAATGGTSYSWSTGSTNDWITVTTAGTYTVHVINSCGTDSATVQVTVNPLPVPLVSGGTSFCKGDSSLLIASGGSSYSWSDGFVGSSHYVHNSGSYTVTATNTCGSTSTSVNVTVNSITAGYIQSADSGYYPLPVIFTDTSKVNPVSWSWTFGDGGTSSNQNPNNTYSTSGTYTVTLTVTSAAGCVSTKTSVITISDTPSWIVVPTVFTPNGDGTNDLLLISSAGIVEFHADFFDRWGVLLASINNVNEAWDGRTVGGQALSNGTYYYVITAKGDDKRVFNLKGFVELIH